MADPNELKNSRRVLDKLTYAPVIVAENGASGGALETATAFRALNTIPGEAASAKQNAPKTATPVLDAVERLTSASTAGERLQASAELAKYSTAQLTAAVAAIHTQREDALNACVAQVVQIVKDYRKAQPKEPAATRKTAPAGAAAGAQNRALTASAGAAMILAGVPATTTVPTLTEALPAPVAALIGTDAAPDVFAALTWAQEHEASAVTKVLGTPAAVLPPGMRDNGPDLALAGLLFLIKQSAKTAPVQAHLTRRSLQPIGVLHLEQLVTTPLAVERGELLYSLPMAPGEKVTLSHKEWTLKEEEYTRFVQDHLENYSELGTAEATDLSVSSRSETEHSKTLSMSKPSAPGAVTVADPVNTTDGVTDATKETQSQEQSRRDTRQITQKASSLSIRDQKVSFTVATTTGTQDFTSRVYENKHDDKLMMVDYFRRMRHWRNDLYRTGVRLTYDVVLPDPGKRLRERWMQVKALDAQLAAPFSFDPGFTYEGGSPVLQLQAGAVGGTTFGAKSWLTRPTDFDSMSPDDLKYYARQYGITLPDAPDQLKSVEDMVTIAGKGGADNAIEFPIRLGIPDGYRPTVIHLGGRIAVSERDGVFVTANYWNEHVNLLADGKFAQTPLNVAPGDYASKTIAAGFLAYGEATGEGRVRADLVPTAENWRNWRAGAFAQLRQGALARFNEQRETLRQQRAALFNELQAADTLALRRMEREQIMYLVLEWLFPDFGKDTAITQAIGSTDSTAWEAVLEYGEYIKFVHDAIDWDRILVLLYPYFWDRPENHADKLYLNHPDGTHREFLRAGAARVILAIKPGYEGQVVSLLDQGSLGALAPASRFQKVIESVQAAERKFEDLRARALAPLGPKEDPQSRAEFPGTLIGQWFEYTPTPALDMDVTFRPVDGL